MSRRLLTIRRSLVLLALGGTTLGLFGGVFGPAALGGCNYATYGDYQTMYTGSGQAVIQAVSDGLFSFGADWDAIVRVPTTNFARAVYANWVDARVPDDLPNNPIVAR